MRSLSKGDIVELILPSSACSFDEYEKAVEFVRKIGLVPRVREYKELVSEGEIFVSNSDEYRFNHLRDAVAEEDSKAIWCIKGGYGSARLLEKLDKVKKPAKEKLFIGFSDNTILLNYFVQKWGWACIHGPVLKQLANGYIKQDRVLELEDLIFGKSKIVSVPKIKAVNEAAKEGGVVEAKIIGGCLSLMQTLIGTKNDFDAKGNILLLEDIGEAGSRLDRMFNHLYRAGKFDGTKAVLLGNFKESNDLKGPQDEELKKVFDNLAKLLDEKNIPLIHSPVLGHTEDMLAMPLGIPANLNLGKKPVLEIKTGF